MKVKNVIHRLFLKKVPKWYIHFFATLFLTVGLVLGGYFTSEAIQSVFADSQATITRNTDTHFDAGTLSSTTVTGSGTGAYVTLDGTTGPDGTTIRNQITFDNTTANLGTTAEELTDFPVLVKVTSSDVDYDSIQDAGEDIRFTDSDGTTEIPYEIEKWDESGTSLIWVKVPTIDSNSSSDSIYMYYGSGSAVDEQDPTSVWGSDYSMVYHLNEGVGTSGSGSVSDSTTNTSGTPSSIIFGESGQIGDAADFSSGTGISLGSLNSPLLTADTTVSFWINTTSFSSPSRQNPFEQAYGGWGTMTIETNGRISWFFGSSGQNANPYASHQSSSGTITNGSWIHITGVRNTSGTSYSWYKNGAYLTGTTYNASYPVIASREFKIGDGYVNPIEGKMDEFRVEKVARSAAWIAARYHMETDDFNTVGSAETILSSSGSWTSPTDSNVIDLAWNGGWGDGSTGSSTAFSATVANVTSNATVTFKIRTASTTGGLTSEAWSTIGTVNTGTTFTADKDDMDALSLDTGTDGRYVQIQAEIAQTDGNNPQIDSIALTYLSDDTVPNANASSLAMLKAAGGASISDGDWTNGDSPYFSWTDGTDTQSGIKGYCLYLGTSSSGDPASDKGLLGTSPVSTTGSTCQFIVSGTNIDLSTGSYQGGTWLTSSASSYYLNVKAVDNANNIIGSSAQFEFKYDDTKPTNPSFISMPSDFIATEIATITWPTSGGSEATDAHSDIAGLQYRIGASGTWYGDSHTGGEDFDDLLADDGSYTTQETPDFASIEEGNNLVYFRTWDNAGNVTTTYVSGVLKVNTVAPGVPQSLGVTPDDATTNSYAFSWDAPSTFTGSEANLTYCYTINTLPTANTCAFTSAGQTTLSAGAYATQPGTNTMYIVAKDEAGNINYDTYASVEFEYSGSAPGIPGSIDIADISVKSTSSWKLAVSWEEPSDTGAGISSYKVYRSTTATSCSSSFSSFEELGTTGGISYTDTGLSQTDYYYCVKACDSANNCGAVSSTVTAYPDGKFTTAAALTSGPATSSVTTQKATITWATDRTSDSKVAFGTSSGSYSSEEVSNSTQTTDHTINLTNLKAGTTYYYKAKWTDEDGNTGESEEKSFTTDPAPAVKEATVSNISISSALVTFTASGATKAKIYYGPTTTFGGIAEISTSTVETTYTVQLTGLSDDTKYFYKINTFDSEDEEYEGDINSFTTLPRPRISNVLIQEVKQAANPTVLVTWDTNTDVSSILTYYPEGNAAAARDEVDVARVSGRHRMLLKGLTNNSKYAIVVKGVDKAGNEAQSDVQSFTTATDTRPPLISDLNVEGNVNVSQVEGENQSVQLIVSWNTDEPSTSQVEFGEGTGSSYSQQTQEDKNLTFNHVVIIPGLTQRKVYHLRAISKDEQGNTGRSIDTVTITPRLTDDALDLVLSNLRETFGFLDAILE